MEKQVIRETDQYIMYKQENGLYCVENKKTGGAVICGSLKEAQHIRDYIYKK